ncbi:MAG: hypothetical protein FWF05_08605 [Oscillospiraceae bacterium]|nr:hypothetical protein [Oscillospiraceae bacterium]
MDFESGKWDKLRSAYKKSLGLPFCDKVNAYMRCLHWNAAVFELRTELTPDTYYRISRRELKNPKKNTIIALCAGLGLDYRLSTDLLQSAGHSLSAFDEIDNAHDYVLTELHGQPLEVCNRELVRRGIEPLGTKEHKRDKIGKKKIS